MCYSLFCSSRKILVFLTNKKAYVSRIFLFVTQVRELPFEIVYELQSKLYVSTTLKCILAEENWSVSMIKLNFCNPVS